MLDEIKLIWLSVPIMTGISKIITFYLSLIYSTSIDSQLRKPALLRRSNICIEPKFLVGGPSLFGKHQLHQRTLFYSS